MKKDLQERLYQREEKSFYTLGMKQGLTPDQADNFLQWMLERSLEENSHQQEVLGNSDLTDLPDFNDFWKFSRYRANLDFENAVDAYRQALKSHDIMSVDHAFLSRIAQKMQLRYDADCDPLMRAEVIAELPRVQNFELNFNAFATIDRDSGIPFLEYYHLLQSALRALCFFLSGCCYRHEDGSSWARPDEELVHPAFLAQVLPVVERMIDWARGESGLGFTYSTYDDFDETAAFLFGGQFYIGASKFVLLHEIAHIVLGHLHGSKAAHDCEYEADEFAMRTLIASDEPEYTYAAVASINLIFTLFRAISTTTKSTLTHPHPSLRANRLIPLAEALIPSGGLDLYGVMTRLLLPLNQLLLTKGKTD